LADPHISPLNTIAYYTAMVQMMGKPAAGNFARLYLFPGGYHCGGGEGPFNVDLLSAIMGWVERGNAPNALIASHTAAGSPAGPSPEMAPLAVSKPDRTRPVYPYPLIAKYSGSGSIDDAANFSAGDPEPAPAAMLNWLGSSFYRAHYEVWCTGNGPSMKCQPTP
jgi:feruloyl esterase